jgi:hypothetical protein
MTDDVPMPALGDALRGWRDARKETEAHLDDAGPYLTTAWTQKLSGLLTTELVWQEQYTKSLGSGSGVEFPESRR